MSYTPRIPKGVERLLADGDVFSYHETVTRSLELFERRALLVPPILAAETLGVSYAAQQAIRVFADVPHDTTRFTAQIGRQAIEQALGLLETHHKGLAAIDVSALQPPRIEYAAQAIAAYREEIFGTGGVASIAQEAMRLSREEYLRAGSVASIAQEAMRLSREDLFGIDRTTGIDPMRDFYAGVSQIVQRAIGDMFRYDDASPAVSGAIHPRRETDRRPIGGPLIQVGDNNQFGDTQFQGPIVGGNMYQVNGNIHVAVHLESSGRVQQTLRVPVEVRLRTANEWTTIARARIPLPLPISITQLFSPGITLNRGYIERHRPELLLPTWQEPLLILQVEMDGHDAYPFVLYIVWAAKVNDPHVK